MKRIANRNLEQAAQLYQHYQVLLNSNLSERFVKTATALLSYRGWVDFIQMGGRKVSTVLDLSRHQNGFHVKVKWDFVVKGKAFLFSVLNLLKIPQFNLGPTEQEIIPILEKGIVRAMMDDLSSRDLKSWNLKYWVGEMFLNNPQIKIQKILLTAISTNKKSQGAIHASLYLVPISSSQKTFLVSF